MIICKRCAFEVADTMRHSLINNCCPSCGAALLGDLHMQRLRLLRERVLEQSFSQNLDDSLIFDMTLFMLTEFFPERSETSSEEVLSDIVKAGKSQPLSKDADSNDTPPIAEEDYESIRSEVRTEMMSKMDSEVESSDLDLKVARLKRIAKEKAVSGTGPAVRRITD